jgi:hypothetical protein
MAPDARQNDTAATLPSLANRNPCRPVLTNLFIIKPSVLPLRPEWAFVKGCTYIIMDDLDGLGIHSDACKTDANDVVHITKNVQLLIGVDRARPCIVPEVFAIENQSAKI